MRTDNERRQTGISQRTSSWFLTALNVVREMTHSVTAIAVLHVKSSPGHL